MPLYITFSRQMIALLAGVLALLAVGIAIWMVQLTAVEQLWGHLPLWLYLFAWSSIVLWIVWWRQRKGRIISWRRLGLATSSGILLSIGFPGFLPFPWLMFIGFIPLLILEREIREAKQRGEKVRLFPYFFHAILLWNIITTYWVSNTAFAAGLFAMVANTLLLAIPFMLFHYTARVLPRFAYLAFIAYWLTFEMVHLTWELSWPWLTLGHAFAQVHATVQWYEYTGVFGGSLWILGMNVWLYALWLRYRAGEPLNIRTWWGPAAVIILPIVISLGMYQSYQPATEERTVVIVQPNYEPHYQKSRVPESDQVDRMIRLAQSELIDEVDYLLLPETVFGYAQRTKLNEYPAVQQLRQSFGRYPGLEIVSGLDAIHILEPGEAPTRATRERTDASGQTYYLEVYNAAAQFTIGADSVQFYKKSRLVPGAEIFPLPWLFFFMQPVVEQLGGTTAGFGSQPLRTPFVGPRGRVAPVICYESVYGEYFAGYVRLGAQAAFIMTNDGWWDHTPGHRQHLYFASLRAIESRRSIARAANTGVSAFISERGDRLAKTSYDEAVALTGQITLNDEITFYVRWGDLIARIALFVSILLILKTIAEVWRGRVERSS